jgi:hypothetical protein
MDLIVFFVIYFAGFFSAIGMFLTLIFWKELIESVGYWKERVIVKWLMWKHR